jgi:hypothetical protein
LSKARHAAEAYVMLLPGRPCACTPSARVTGLLSVWRFGGCAAPLSVLLEAAARGISQGLVGTASLPAGATRGDRAPSLATLLLGSWVLRWDPGPALPCRVGCHEPIRRIPAEAA